MNRINDWLHIGNFWATHDTKLLERTKIGAMLQLAESVSQQGIAHLYLPVSDGQYLPHHLIQEGMVFVKQHHSEGKQLLIACRMGRSRSAAFCMAAIKEIHGFTLLQAFRTLRTNYTLALPHQQLLRSLCDYYHEEYQPLTAEVHWQG